MLVLLLFLSWIFSCKDHNRILQPTFVYTKLANKQQLFNMQIERKEIKLPSLTINLVMLNKISHNKLIRILLIFRLKYNIEAKVIPWSE